MQTLLRGGTVVDPEARTERVADVLVQDGAIVAVGPDLAASDAAVVDVTGCIVGPGFVDLHSHVHSIAGHRLQAMDGVTTALDLEAGLMPVAEAIARAEADGRPLNYGFSASWAQARALAHLGIQPIPDFHGHVMGLVGHSDWSRSSTPAERTRWLGALEGELAAGALGIGVLMGYAPRTAPAEYVEVAKLAAAANAPVYTHVRQLVEVNPDTLVDGSEELVRAAGETGAAMHHCHVNSTSLRHVDRVLALIERAHAAGSPVTVEAYPYGAGSTAIGAGFLDPDVLHQLDIGPQQIMVVETGEWVADADRLRELRAADPGAPCVVAMLDDDDPFDREVLRRSLVFPDSIVASDAMPVTWPTEAGGTVADTREWPLPAGGRTHPRTAGTFTRSLRMLVLEIGDWSWAEAFRRCSYLPSRLLDDVSAPMRRKGRLREGADADLVVIDPTRLTDNATYTDPTRPASGVRHLFVGGTPVVRDSDVVVDAFPGRAVRGIR